MVRCPQRMKSAILLVSVVVVCAACRYRPASFDLTAARRQGDLAATEGPSSQRAPDGMSLREVSFQSTFWDASGPHPIRIRALVATPPGSAPPHTRPGVIFAHGLGGQADAGTAIDIARNTGAVALSLSGPGLGGSEGRPVLPQDASALFPLPAPKPDIRTSWLYGYVFAILRSITYLETRSDVDPQAIAVTGYSLGGLATFIANGVDGRIRGALPVAAAGGLAEAAAADTWLRRLVQSSNGLQPSDPGPQTLFTSLDPLAFARRQRGAVYMLIGAQDEYFPLPQAIRTYDALSAPDVRMVVVPDYDHGWYFGGGCPARCMPGGSSETADCPSPPQCPAACPPGSRPPYCGPEASYNREPDFNARWGALLKTLLAEHVDAPRRARRPLPEPPSLKVRGDEVVIRTEIPASAVRLLISDNCGFTYGQITLERGADGAYRHRARIDASTVLFAEAEFPEGAILTSLPRWPETCPIRVRPFGPHP